MVSEDGNHIFGYAIDVAGGTAQAIAGLPITALPAQTQADPALTYLMVDHTGRYLYVTRFPSAAPGPEHVLVFAIDRVTGGLSAISKHLL
jgi:6-phosphogluconolactonase (cycloisomerase 2 family)